MGDEFDRNRRYVDSMTQDEIEKEMKGPESPGVKKPGKIPLSANKQAITEEPATVSSTSQNYKQTPDMNKGTLEQNRAGRGEMRGSEAVRFDAKDKGTSLNYGVGRNETLRSEGRKSHKEHKFDPTEHRSRVTQRGTLAVNMPKSMDEPITKSDEAALKKSISDATTLMKAMKISVERL